MANFDASYVYLLNATDIASGHFSVGNIVHPGTPAEIFAAIVILIKHLFTGNGSILYQDVLLHPESYLLACSVGITVLFTLGAYFAGAYVFRNSGNMLLALLFQLSPLLYREMIEHTILLSAESLMVVVNMYFIPYLYINTVYKRQFSGRKTTDGNVLLFGLYTALLFTIKIYCASICILILFLLNNNRQRIRYLISHTVFSLLLLFPVYGCFRDWLGTVKSLLFHQGAYGQGGSGLINANLYKNNIVDIFTTHYIFSAVYLFILIAFTISIRRALNKKVDAFGSMLPITGVFIFFILFVLMIAKQYTVIYPEPVTHELINITKYYYFISLIGCFPLFICVAYSCFPFDSYLQKYGYLLVGAFIVFAGVRAYDSCYMARSQDVTPQATSEFLEKWKTTPLIIVSDGNKSCVQPALFLGIAYSGPWGAPEYTAFVKKAYPSTYLYTTYNNQLLLWDQPVDIKSILKKNKQALVYVSGKDSITTSVILSGICGGTIAKNTYSKIYCNTTKYEDVYLLKADTLQ